MVESASPSETTLVAVLFPLRPCRSSISFVPWAISDRTTISAPSTPSRIACGLMNRELAKGIVSDALLLAFGLRRERRAPLDYRPVRSRRGTLDEYRLMALMAATGTTFILAAAAAASLDISTPSRWCPWLDIRFPKPCEPPVPDRGARIRAFFEQA